MKQYICMIRPDFHPVAKETGFWYNVNGKEDILHEVFPER